MKKHIKFTLLLALIIAVISTGLIMAMADQENEFEEPCEHEYQITAFNHGEITFTCEICEDTYTDYFVKHINERGYEPIDMNHDGIVNGKDYAYLMRNYQQ